MTKSLGIRKHYPKDVNAQVIELVGQGVPPPEICQRLEIPMTKVRNVLRKAGVTYTHEARSAIASAGHIKRGRVYAPGTTEHILDLWSQEVPRKAIAEQVGVSIDKVHSDINYRKKS